MNGRYVGFWYPGIPTGSNAGNRMRGKGAWHIVSRERESVREQMWPILLGLQASPEYWGPFPVAEIEATFCWPDRRKRDVPNFAESLKAIIDSLRGVLIVDDDVTHLPRLVLGGVLGAEAHGIRIVVREVREA